MPPQLHKRLTTEQVTDLLDKYLARELKAKEAQAYLGVGRTRFYQLVAAYEEDGSQFSIAYERSNDSRRIDAAIERSIRRELARQLATQDRIFSEALSKLDALIAKIERRLRMSVRFVFWELLDRMPSSAEEEYWINEVLIQDSYSQIKQRIASYYGVDPNRSVRSSSDDGFTISILDTPAAVASTFKSVYGRDITPAESTYWKKRARSDKPTVSTLEGAMLWHKARGSSGVQLSKTTTVSRVTAGSLAPRINALFRSVYGRNPSPPENQYWLSRIGDKPIEGAMFGAMIFHQVNNISH